MFMLGWNVWDSVPFGPLTVTQLPSDLDLDTCGNIYRFSSNSGHVIAPP